MRRGWPGRPRRTPLCAAALAVSGIGVAELASQQRYEDPRVVVSGDVTFASEYNWRGLTRVNNWVLQPDAYVAADLGALSSGATETIRFSLSAGIWADVEIRDPGPGEHSDRGGPGFGELNPWLQLGAGMGDVDLALGVTPYFYFGDALDFPSARTSASNTTELYLDARTRGRTVDARATWWLDIDEIGGSYFETAATLHIPFVPSFFAPDPVLADLELDAILGWSAGQGVDPGDPARPSNFDGDGLTHAAFSLSSGLVVWGVRIEPAFHVQVNRDAATRRVRLPGVPPPPDPDVESGLNTWWTFIVSPVRLLGFGDRS